MTYKSFATIAIITILISGIPQKARSCPIPVFRYALELWEADPYIVDIFYRNSLEPSEQMLADNLRELSSTGNRKANIEIRKTDIAGNIDDITRGFINTLSPEEYPFMAIRYPRISGNNKVIWSGPLTKENTDLLLNSPARREIAEGLTGNATAVWVLVESGDSRKDRETRALIEKELRRLEQTLVLPDLELWWQGSKDDENAPTIKFDLVSISRDDPSEKLFLKMLLDTEDDLFQFDTEPMLFPFYGRGIALWAIVGRGINEWNIMEAAEFLTGPCSCQAKLLNPGIDMLFSINWEEEIEFITDMSISNPLSGMGDFTSRESQVRQQLESITTERLGTLPGRTTGQSESSANVVYIDIFGDNNNSTEREEVETVQPATGGATGGAIGEATGEATQPSPSATRPEQPQPQAETSPREEQTSHTTANLPSDRPAISDTHTSDAVEKTDTNISGNRRFSTRQTLMAIIGGIVVVVLVTSVFLYYRH